MLRLPLLFLILGGLAFFTLQNLTPIPLVILGIQTQALPLSVWMLIAIAAGGLSTVVIGGLFKASNLFAAPKRRATAGRSRQTAVGSSSGPAWMPNWSKSDPDKTATSTASGHSGGSRSRPEQAARANGGEDWNSFDNKLEEWEDWDGYQDSTPSASSSTASARTSYQEPAYQDPRTSYQDPRTVIQDVEPESELEEWEDWDGYEDQPRDRNDRDNRNDRNYRDSRDARDGRDNRNDWDSRNYRDNQDDPDDEEEWSDRPNRTDFEVLQQPKSVSRTGTIYSYRYRDDSPPASRSQPDRQPDSQPDRQPDSRPPEGNPPGAVYDADYRVITPPYRPDPDQSQPEAEDWAVAQDPPEDWDDEDESDRPRR